MCEKGSEVGIKKAAVKESFLAKDCCVQNKRLYQSRLYSRLPNYPMRSRE